MKQRKPLTQDEYELVSAISPEAFKVLLKVLDIMAEDRERELLRHDLSTFSNTNQLVALKGESLGARKLHGAFSKYVSGISR